MIKIEERAKLKEKAQKLQNELTKLNQEIASLNKECFFESNCLKNSEWEFFDDCFVCEDGFKIAKNLLMYDMAVFGIFFDFDFEVSDTDTVKLFPANNESFEAAYNFLKNNGAIIFFDKNELLEKKSKLLNSVSLIDDIMANDRLID